MDGYFTPFITSIDTLTCLVSQNRIAGNEMEFIVCEHRDLKEEIQGIPFDVGNSFPPLE